MRPDVSKQEKDVQRVVNAVSRSCSTSFRSLHPPFESKVSELSRHWGNFDDMVASLSPLATRTLVAQLWCHDVISYR